jgi:hypothetical protein
MIHNDDDSGGDKESIKAKSLECYLQLLLT